VDAVPRRARGGPAGGVGGDLVGPLEAEAAGVELGAGEGEDLAVARDDVGAADERAGGREAALEVDGEVGLAGAVVLGGVERLVVLPDERPGGLRPLFAGVRGLGLVAVALDGRAVRVDVLLPEFEPPADEVLEVSLRLGPAEAGETLEDGVEEAGELGLRSGGRDEEDLAGNERGGGVEEAAEVGGRVEAEVVVEVGPVGEFHKPGALAEQVGEAEGGLAAGGVAVEAEVEDGGGGRETGEAVGLQRAGAVERGAGEARLLGGEAVEDALGEEGLGGAEGVLVVEVRDGAGEVEVTRLGVAE